MEPLPQARLSPSGRQEHPLRMVESLRPVVAVVAMVACLLFLEATGIPSSSQKDTLLLATRGHASLVTGSLLAFRAITFWTQVTVRQRPQWVRSRRVHDLRPSAGIRLEDAAFIACSCYDRPMRLKVLKFGEWALSWLPS
ncbi:hypothetical protein NDU88_000659 [Pleurodeles waltl]|uniref:Uncharacterized protein n=1 Tax=Pleurodeles waltl TaxID=8319 RepID=A0AAV7MLH4_PLEWA|nr:hypothetical protein NDU88_000659 [Pleurodeles waltl]